MRPYPEVALAQHNKARQVLDRVGGEVVQLDPISAHEGDEKRMEGERQTPVDVVHEADPLED